jgi:stage II sporulation protein R
MKFKLLKIEKAVLCGVLIAVIAASVSGFSVFAQQCGDIRSSVFRLHILANSDSAIDQQLKLNVRDQILAHSAEIFGDASNKEQAEQNARAKLPEILSIAQAEIKKEGFSYTVKAQIVNMYFTTRTYGDITLPAGNYDALRITIGAAKGHNWWCVLFPALCVPTAEGTESQKLGDVLSAGEVCVVKNTGKPDVVIKFKSLELCKDFENFLAAHGFKVL